MPVRVLGLKEVMSKLQKTGDEYPKKLVAKATHYAHDKSVKGASKHSKTGRMENNIALRIKGLKGSVFIENHGMETNWKGLNYGVFVHFGTRPHDIRPKNKKALRWVGHGNIFSFAKAVRHPGYRGDPFMYRALDDTEKVITKLAKESLNDTI